MATLVVLKEGDHVARTVCQDSLRLCSYICGAELVFLSTWLDLSFDSKSLNVTAMLESAVTCQSELHEFEDCLLKSLRSI